MLNGSFNKNIQFVVLMTTYNRTEILLKSLNALNASAKSAKVVMDVILANSGSTIKDEKFRAYSSLKVETLQLDPSYYWANGMRKAWEHAQRDRFKYSHILWLNEDVEINYDAVQFFLDSIAEHSTDNGQLLLAGAVQSHAGYVTYSGKKIMSKFQPLKFVDLIPNGDFQVCDTFNGNIVLVDRKTDECLGGFPKQYIHNRADLAYGLESKKSKVTPLLAPRSIGICEANSGKGDFMDRDLSKLQRLSLILTPKGIPPKEWFRFCFRYGGYLAPAYFVVPYIKFLFKRKY